MCWELLSQFDNNATLLILLIWEAKMEIVNNKIYYDNYIQKEIFLSIIQEESQKIKTRKDTEGLKKSGDGE